MLEAQAGQPLRTPGADDASGPYLTLRRLSLWLSEPLKRLRLLAALADGALEPSLPGGQLAGAVYAHTQHGDPFQSRYVSKLLAQVGCCPVGWVGGALAGGGDGGGRGEGAGSRAARPPLRTAAPSCARASAPLIVTQNNPETLTTLKPSPKP